MAMEQLPGLPPRALEKADPTPDAAFYAEPRFVTHIDDRAIAAITELYRQVLAPGQTIIDLMSSWVSHLPKEIAFAHVTGHGMNAEELAANPQLDDWFVQDLNNEARLPMETGTLDAACLCVSVQYLQQPVAVFTEVARILKPGAPFVITFSNRCFPTKAVAIWQALEPPDQQKLIGFYLERSGFGPIETGEVLQPGADPIYAVLGYKKTA